MKIVRGFFVLLASVLLFTACEEREADLPPLVAPVYSGPDATMTIDAFKKFAAAKLSAGNYFGCAPITAEDNVILKGVIVANDISGNIYKQFQIQDETGGLCVAIDQSSLYTSYGVGQTVYINCAGLDMGYYGGYLQLGKIYYNTTQSANQIGQMDPTLAKQQISFDGFPNPAAATSDTITIEEISSKHVGRLITLKNVFIPDGGKKAFAPSNAKGIPYTISQTMASADNVANTIVLRNSSESNFAAILMPAGIGTVTGILSTYQTSATVTYQYAFRDIRDCNAENFNAEGTGSRIFPWSVGYTVNHQDGTQSGWVEGYIVGTVSASVNAGNPIDNNNDIAFVPPFTNSTVVIAASANEKDWTKCVMVNLPAGSLLQSNVDLSQYAENLGAFLKVAGKLTKYMGAAGVQVATGDASEFTLTGGRFLETFESDAANKTSYILADFQGTDAIWSALAVISNADTNDKKNGTRSARLRDPSSGRADAHYIMMTKDKPNGAGTISLYHGMYGTHTGGSWKLEVSNDGGNTWNARTEEVTSVPSTLTKITFNVNVSGNIRIKITKTTASTSTSSTINIDDIAISNYTTPNP